MFRWLLWFVLLPIALPIQLLRWLALRLRPVTALKLTLRGELLDSAPTGGFVRSEGTAFLPVLSTLTFAARDAKLKTVLIRMDAFSSGLGLAEELRSGLKRVRDSGKEVIVHADELGLAGFWAATGASRVALSPAGSVNVTGWGSEFTLLRGLFDKLGISPQLVARGKYKSMKEMFTEKEISEPNKEMILSLLSNLAAQLAARVQESRGLTAQVWEDLLTQAPFRAEAALSSGLVNALQYEDELVQPLKNRKGQRMLDSGSYLKVQRRSWTPRTAPKVALLRVGGNIKSGQDTVGPNGPRATGSTSFGKAVARAMEDSAVKAIILRVNSPGGSALASDLMWRALSLAQEKKPIFVSMANVAASGGYYVSGVKGARVWASPSTITGSIGVVGGKISAQPLLEKLGIKRTQLKISPRATFYSPSVPFDEDELQKLQADIEASYKEFVSKMAQGRGKTFDELHAVAQGRVWTGAEALSHGLIDGLGGLSEVLAAVRESLNIGADAPLALVEFNRQTLLQTIKARLGDSQGIARLEAALPSGVAGEFSQLLGAAKDFENTRLFTLLPIELRFR